MDSTRAAPPPQPFNTTGRSCPGQWRVVAGRDVAMCLRCGLYRAPTDQPPLEPMARQDLRGWACVNFVELSAVHGPTSVGAALSSTNPAE